MKIMWNKTHSLVSKRMAYNNGGEGITRRGFMLNQEEIKTIRETVPLLKDKGQTIT